MFKDEQIFNYFSTFIEEIVQKAVQKIEQKMDFQVKASLSSVFIKNYEQTFINRDLNVCFKYFKELKRKHEKSKSQINQKNIDLAKILKKSKLDLNGLKENTLLYISQIRPDIPIFMILRLLSQIYPIERLFLSNCEIPEDFFQFIGQQKWKLTTISLAVCNIGNKIAEELAWLPYGSLEHLLLESDPFDNRGLKELLKLKLPNLKTLFLRCTNITVDGFKIFPKRATRNMHLLNIFYLLNSHLIVKYIKDIVKLSLYRVCQFKMYGVGEDKQNFIFLNQLAKVDLSGEEDHQIYLYKQNQTISDQINSKIVVERLGSMLIYNYITI